MRVSLSGLLEKAARACDNVKKRNGGEGFAVRELLRNLQELKSRKAEGKDFAAEVAAITTVAKEFITQGLLAGF